MTGPPPGDQFEDGLQRERTALAWNRTALALLVCGSLLIRHLGSPLFDLRHVPAYVALAAGAAVLVLAARDERFRTRGDLRVAQLRPWRAWVVGVIALTLNVASLLIVAAGR